MKCTLMSNVAANPTQLQNLKAPLEEGLICDIEFAKPKEKAKLLAAAPHADAGVSQATCEYI